MDALQADLPSEVVCPHCKKRFPPALISGSSLRYQGFKCPHCRLFVPYERAARAAANPR